MAVAPVNRVVVTGVGAITSLGLTFEETWNNILAGYSGVKRNELHPNIPCKIAGKIARIDNELSISTNDPINNQNPPHINIYDPQQQHMTDDPSIQYALTAACEAMRSSKLDCYLSEIDRYRIGVSFASALGGLESFENNHNNMYMMMDMDNNMMSNMMINTSASAISVQYGLRGPNLVSATACCASAHAIQKGFQLICNGICDIMVVGGTEAAVTDTFAAGLSRCKALATKYNHIPYKASRPWDRNRNGFVMGEGAACLILESEQMAQKRGIKDIYGEIVGVAATSDAFHCTSLDPSGIHVQKCMELAIEDGHRMSNDKQLIDKLGYINAHATSTDIGDKTELMAILALLYKQYGDRKDIQDVIHRNIQISSTKSSIGHLMGAAGAIEAALTLQALKTNMVPPTINLENKDEFVPQYLNLVPNQPQQLSDQCEYAMSNSFGFGGTNASILFKKRNIL